MPPVGRSDKRMQLTSPNETNPRLETSAQFSLRSMLGFVAAVAVAIHVWPVVRASFQNLVDHLRYTPHELEMIRSLREWEEIDRASGLDFDEIDDGPLVSLPSREYWEREILNRPGKEDPNTAWRQSSVTVSSSDICDLVD